ncbi:MAG: cysteine desulfurase [Alphaproteobacteria bacterium]|nr:MAG: cysteine desulfurase [Alphaproteobacteria bacterium]
MEILYHEWISLLVRWLHIITGIAWIGSSFFFVFLDLSLRKRPHVPEGVSGESWLVHGGGFYHVNKWMVAPETMPEDLHWFKWESYYTWMSGFALLAVVYYMGANSFLIDRNVLALEPWQAIGLSMICLASGWVIYDLLCRSPIGSHIGWLAVSVFVLVVGASYVFGELFAARAAFLHVGAMIGTMMTGNVFFIIIPNQKKVVAALKAGDQPDPALGLQAKQRSTHNNYLTLPVLLMMISNHYPMTFGAAHNWVVVAGILIVGGVVRDYFNSKNAGLTGGRLRWQWPVAALVTLLLMVFTAPRVISHEGAEVSDARVMEIVATHCQGCHSARPTDEDFTEAPAGAAFDTLEDVKARADKIYTQVVVSDVMPLGNKTAMTEAERAELAAWLKAQR